MGGTPKRSQLELSLLHVTHLLVVLFIPTKYESNRPKNKCNIQLWKKVNQKVTLGHPDVREDKYIKNSCLSCMWHTYWSSSLSLPNTKAIHWRIKVTQLWKKVNQQVNQTVNLGRRPMPDAHPTARQPGQRYFKGWIFFLNRPKMGISVLFRSLLHILGGFMNSGHNSWISLDGTSQMG